MNNYSILIVDDEDAQRNVLKGYLEKKGYKILKYGRKSLLGEGGLVHVYRNDILRKVLYTINILLTPLYYYVQDFSDYVFVAYKDVEKKP